MTTYRAKIRATEDEADYPTTLHSIELTFTINSLAPDSFAPEQAVANVIAAIRPMNHMKVESIEEIKS